MLNSSMEVCPMYLLYKCHKGRDKSMGTIPPTRPVASGNQGMNIHISELLSEIIEPVVDNYHGSREVISTEDMVARMLGLDSSLEGWNENYWWSGLSSVDGKYEACRNCMGSMEYVYSMKNPEVCKCGYVTARFLREYNGGILKGRKDLFYICYEEL